MQIVRNQEKGHSIKKQSGKMIKTKEFFLYIAKKSPKAKPPFNRK
jgi:hypothetical protein